MESEAAIERQPFLPRVGMIWFFIVVTLVAIAVVIVRSAEQGRALAAAIAFTGLFVFFLSVLSAAFFFVAYLFGATDKAVTDAQAMPASPFSDGAFPEQILPPRVVEE